MGNRWIPISILSVAILGLLGAIISISVGEYREEEFRITGSGEVQQLIGGIEQQGDRLGDSDAPITIDVFTDVQAPEGAEYQADVVDPLVVEYARTGQAVIVLRHYPLGPKPITFGGIASEAAGLQDRQWQYAELFMRNLDEVPEQGVSQDFLNEVASSVPELEVVQWERDNGGTEATELADQDEALGTQLKLPADPAVVVGGPGGSKQLEDAPSLDEIRAAIDEVR